MIRKCNILEKNNGFLIESNFNIDHVRYRIEIVQTAILCTTFRLLSYDEEPLSTLGHFSNYVNNKKFVLNLDNYSVHNLSFKYWDQYDKFNHIYKALIKRVIGI